MRVVLYADDMEPITVLDLPMWAIDLLKVTRHVTIPVILPPPHKDYTRGQQPNYEHLRVVRIVNEVLHRNGKQYLLCTTFDEESALLLKSAFLPGQIKDVRRAEKDAFIAGMLKVLGHMQ